MPPLGDWPRAPGLLPSVAMTAGIAFEPGLGPAARRALAALGLIAVLLSGAPAAAQSECAFGLPAEAQALARRAAAFLARAGPEFEIEMTLIRRSKRRTRSAVVSWLPSSTTMIASPGRKADRRPCRVRSMVTSALNAGTTAVHLIVYSRIDELLGCEDGSEIPQPLQLPDPTLAPTSLTVNDNH